MAYLTLQQLERHYGREEVAAALSRPESTEPTGPTDPGDQEEGSSTQNENPESLQTLFDQLENDARARVDGALAGRYQVPLAPPPDLVVSIMRRLVWYGCFRHGAPDYAARDMENAQRDLEGLAKGFLRLTESAPSTQVHGTGTGLLHKGAASDFEQETQQAYLWWHTN